MYVSPGVPTKIIGVCAGLTGFAVATIAGLAAENQADHVLLRALVAMAGCQVVGWIAGTVCERIVREALREYRAANPINSSSTPAAGAAVDTVKVASSAA